MTAVPIPPSGREKGSVNHTSLHCPADEKKHTHKREQLCKNVLAANAAANRCCQPTRGLGSGGPSHGYGRGGVELAGYANQEEEFGVARAGEAECMRDVFVRVNIYVRGPVWRRASSAERYERLVYTSTVYSLSDTPVIT